MNIDNLIKGLKLRIIIGYFLNVEFEGLIVF